MRIYTALLFTLASSVASVSSAVSVAANPVSAIKYGMWNKIKTPQKGQAQSLGFYTAGCLIGGQSVEDENILIMHPARNRYYGHPMTIEYLKKLAAKIRHNRVPFLLVGDIAGPRGGPMLDGHASHNNGLDADIWYLRRESSMSRDQRNTMESPLYALHRTELSKNWGKDQVELVTTAVDSPLVDRVFVAPAIKKYFCEHNPDAPWLYKLRAWWGHDEHFHVRLKCPAGSASVCQHQAELDPAEPQCGKDLDWWMSKRADQQWKDMTSGPNTKAFPGKMPKLCQAMIPFVEPVKAKAPEKTKKPENIPEKAAVQTSPAAEDVPVLVAPVTPEVPQTTVLQPPVVDEGSIPTSGSAFTSENSPTLGYSTETPVNSWDPDDTPDMN